LSIYQNTGIPCCRQRWAGWDDGDQKYKKRKNKTKMLRFPPFRILGTPKQKIFFSFLKKIGRAQNLKKCRENFSVLGRKLLQSLRAEAGRRLKIGIGIFVKKSSNFVQ